MQMQAIAPGRQLGTASIDAAKWAAIVWAMLGIAIGSILICIFEMADKPALTGPTLLAMAYIAWCTPGGYRWCRQCRAEIKLAALATGICIGTTAMVSSLILFIIWMATHQPQRLAIMVGVLLVACLAYAIEPIEAKH